MFHEDDLRKPMTWKVNELLQEMTTKTTGLLDVKRLVDRYLLPSGM
jgi:hypothetical protein